MQLAASLTPFCTFNFSLQVIKDKPISQNSFYCNFFLSTYKTCLLNLNRLYKGREKEYSKIIIN